MALQFRSGLAWSILALLGWLPVQTRAEDKNVTAPAAAAVIRFNRDIRPLFSNRCFKCHGPDLKRAGLDLQSRESAIRPLKSGNVPVVPGKSAESHLIERLSSPDEDFRMPPKGKGDRLTAEQIDKLRAWIDQGAHWEEHWAYVKPESPPLPAVKNKSWPRNDVDYFVLARLEEEGLTPSPEADRTTLIRRVTLDLIGLPPSLEEVDAFLADADPNAYEKVVDRLLALAALW